MAIHKAKPLAGISLNYEVVGGTTAPTNPKENTIWINTDVAIGEHQFSYTQPTTRIDGSTLQAGDIWLQTAETTKYNFNALKKNELYLHVKNIYQLINGGWQEAVASIYQNGAWTKFFYDTVVVDTSTTAPVNTWNRCYGWEDWRTTGGVSSSDGLWVRVDNDYGSMIEQVQRDFSGYSKIEIYVTQKYGVNSRDGESYFGIVETPNAAPNNADLIVKKINTTSTGTFTLDISDYNGTGYLCLNRRVGGYTKITKIKLYV